MSTPYRGGRRAPLVTGAAAVLVLGSGCGSLDPAAEGAEELHAYFAQTYPDHVVDTPTTTSNELPWMGSLYATVLLAEDTPADVLQRVYQDLLDFDAPARVTYVPVGIGANGVGICADDPHQEDKQRLREALRAAGQSLRGSWACPLHGRSDNIDYLGDWEQFLVDTDLVQGLPGDADDLELFARIRDVDVRGGAVTGIVSGSWSQIGGIEQVVPALEAASRNAEIRTFTLTGSSLTVAVQPTGSLDIAQQAARQAAGTDLHVELTQGSTDPAQQTWFAQLAPLADELRVLGPVSAVTADSAGLTVITSDPTAVAQIAAVIDAHPEALELTRVTMQVERLSAEGTSRDLSRYEQHPGSAGEFAAAFAALLDVPDLFATNVTERDPDQPARIVLRLGPDALQGLADAKAVLPRGAQVVALGATEHGGIEFTVADQLRVEDISRPLLREEDLSEIVRVWNEAP